MLHFQLISTTHKLITKSRVSAVDGADMYDLSIQIINPRRMRERGLQYSWLCVCVSVQTKYVSTWNKVIHLLYLHVIYDKFYV